MAINLSEEQMQELQALMDDADAANPEDVEDAPEMEEAAEADEADAANEAAAALGEGDGAAADAPAVPDPNAGAAQPAAPALPEGVESVEQLIQLYNEMRAQGDEMATLRELNEQLVAIAEALGYGQDVESVPLPTDEIDQKLHAKLKPMLEMQQKTLRGRMIDQGWRRFFAENTEAREMMDDIKEVLKESPELSDDERGAEIAYTMARAKRYKPEKALFEDKEFIDRAAANEKVKEKVIAEYLKRVAKSGEGAPMSVGTGGSAVPVGKKKYSMEDAHKAMRGMLG
jgi:hypothetical protein